MNCGTGKWNQTFAYDPYGNINKTGSGIGTSFQATYNTATNRISALPGFTPTYDAAGNLLNDSFHQYQWDGDGKPTQIDSVGLTYDALGRMVEQNRSGAYTQIVYGPGGNKLALMNGQTLVKAFVPLPGGATAVYNSSGLQYYRHSDWLGNSRLASKPNRTVHFDGAYAPFGEDYAKTGTTDLNFTGQNQDTVQGDYDFMFREYSPAQGRWVRPDPAGLAAVNLTNPQSWNRYAYVLNNPLRVTDPLGLLGSCSDSDSASFADCDYTDDSDGFGGSAGGGGGGCTIDGVRATCGMANGLLSMNAAVRCPIFSLGPSCVAAQNGRLFMFGASTNGIGSFFPSTGPGFLFSSLQEALNVGALWAQAESFDRGYENCGLTFASGSFFSFSSTVEGTRDGCSPGGAKIPVSATKTGGFHGHGRPDFWGNSNPERFSGQPGDYGPGGGGDTAWAQFYGVPISLATPGGRAMIYYPASNCQVFLQGGPAGSGTTIPVCTP